MAIKWTGIQQVSHHISNLKSHITDLTKMKEAVKEECWKQGHDAPWFLVKNMESRLADLEMELDAFLKSSKEDIK